MNNTEDFLRYFQREITSLVIAYEVFERAAILLREQFSGYHFEFYKWHDEQGRFSVIAGSSPHSFFVYDDTMLWLSDREEVLFCHGLHLGKAPEQSQLCSILSCDIILPISLNGALMGFVSIRLPSGTRHLELGEWKDIRSSLVTAVANASLYERLEKLNVGLERKVAERTRELESAQASLVQNEKLASLGTLAAGIAHEINTPSAVISSGIDKMEEILPALLTTLLERSGYSEDSLSIFRKALFPPDRRIISSGERFQLSKTLKLFFTEQGISHPKTITILTGLAIDLDLDSQPEHLLSISPEEIELTGRLFSLSQTLRNIHSSIRSVTRIVRSLKQYSHADEAETKEISVEEGIENTLVILQNQFKTGIEIKTNYLAQKHLRAWPGELNQVWTNLFVNAVQAMNGNGLIEISTNDVFIQQPVPSAGEICSKEMGNRETADAKNSTPFVRITISDTGPGIPAALQRKIFDPFFTTKAPGEGTGLGLGIVQGIVQKHGGFLSLESTEGKGSRFFIYLPSLPIDH